MRGLLTLCLLVIFAFVALNGYISIVMEGSHYPLLHPELTTQDFVAYLFAHSAAPYLLIGSGIGFVATLAVSLARILKQRSLKKEASRS